MQQFYRNGKQLEWDSENPVITCLMSVYNGQTYLREAMDSILDQTYANFEFLIINDGSTDDSVKIIESYDDPRIRLIHNEENIGLTKSLNKGIDLARGEYIARMDADDVSLEERFERQLRLHKNYKEDYFSFATNEIDVIKNLDKLDSLQKNDYLRLRLLFGNFIIHSSAFFRKTKLRYDESFFQAQDYMLWIDFVNSYKFYCHIEKLVELRIHENSVSSKSRTEQLLAAKRAQSNFLSKFIESKPNENYLVRLTNKFDRFNSSDLVIYEILFLKIKKKILETGLFSKKVVKVLFNYKWKEITKTAKYENLFYKFRYKFLVRF